MGSYGALAGGIVGVIGGHERPRVSADSTAIANCERSVRRDRRSCQAGPTPQRCEPRTVLAGGAFMPDGFRTNAS
jgi:hypothetical protein